MFRIDNSTAVAALPVIPPPGPPGYFTNGNPVSGQDATIVDDWWMNTVQEEIAHVIEASGIALDKSNHGQLFLAIQSLITSSPEGPDYDPFLPLVGGQLYNPGGADPLSIYADAGKTSRIRYVSGTSHAFYTGVDTTGRWHIYDAFRNKIAFEVLQDVDNSIHLYTPTWIYNNLLVTGGLTGQQSIAATANISAGGNITANGQITAQGTISTAGEVNASGSMSMWDVKARGGLYVGSRNLGIVDTGNADNQLYVNGGFQVPGLLTAGTLATGSTGISGPLNVTGAANFQNTLATAANLSVGGPTGLSGSLNVLGAASFQNTLAVAASISCTSLTVSGPASITSTLNVANNIAGANNITASGSIYATAGGIYGRGFTAGDLGYQCDGNVWLRNGGQVQFTPNTVARCYVAYANLDWLYFAEAWGSPPLANTNWFAVFNGGISVLSGGNGFKSGGGMWGDSSESRFKADIEDYRAGLDVIRGLRPRTYRFLSDLSGRGMPGDRRYHGLVAEEVEGVMPELLGSMSRRNAKGEPETLKTIDATAVVYALVNAVKELAAEIETLKATIH